ncbi:MAG: hypothetical protein AB1700_17335 [Bacillota bacterium]
MRATHSAMIGGGLLDCGHQAILPGGRVIYCVEFVSIDTSAERSQGSVYPSRYALELKSDVMTSFWPHYDFLGDSHTHPYGHFSDVLLDKLHEFSEEDFQDIENRSRYWRKHGYRVGIMLTIARLEKRGRRYNGLMDDTTIEFTLGNYRLWLKGYVAIQRNTALKLPDHEDEDVILDCPALIGLNGEYSRFGRVTKRNAFKCGQIE